MNYIFKENSIYDLDCDMCGENGLLVMHADHVDYENAVGDFNLHLLDGSSGLSGDNVVSLVKTIELSNGSGNSSFSCQQPSNGNIELKVAVSTSGDPGVNGTGNSGT